MSRLAPDWLGNYFSYGIDNRRRRVFMHGDVDEETIGHLTQAFLLLDAESTDNITFYISSFGGSMYEMFGLYDVIRSCRSFVTGIAHGKNMSAAPLILRAADDAQAYPNTQFMSHEESWGGEEKGHSHLKVDMQHYESMEKRWARLMGRRTKLRAAAWTAMAGNGRDRYFDAQQALTWGVIDGILLPDGIVFRGGSK